MRYRSSLTDRVRERAILAVAAHWDCGFERYAHEPAARRARLTEDEVLALGDRAPLALDDPAEAAALHAGHVQPAAPGPAGR